MSTTDWNQPAMQRNPMMGGGMQNRWIPPQEVADHLGNPIPQNWDFFAAPPPNIGNLVTAGSTLDLGEEPMAPATRMIIAIVAAGVAGGIGLTIGFIMEAIPLPGTIGIGAVLAALGFWIAWAFTSFDHTCQFVGSEGVASITCSGSRTDLAAPEVFRFEQAAEVRNSIVHNYNKYGVYQGTNYSFVWADPAGNAVYTISGSHNYENNFPPSNDPYCFGFSAEEVWTRWIFQRVLMQIQQTGFYQFNVEGSGHVRVGQGYAEFNLDGTPQRLRSEEIAFANLDAGMLTIRRHGATEGWFSSDGIYTFGYGSLGNAQLFLRLFGSLVKNIT